MHVFSHKVIVFIFEMSEHTILTRLPCIFEMHCICTLATTLDVCLIPRNGAAINRTNTHVPWAEYAHHSVYNIAAFHYEMQSNVLHHIIVVHICYLSVLVHRYRILLLDWLWIVHKCNGIRCLFGVGSLFVVCIHVPLHITFCRTIFGCAPAKKKQLCVQLTMLLTHHLQCNLQQLHGWFSLFDHTKRNKNSTKSKSNESTTTTKWKEHTQICMFTNKNETERIGTLITRIRAKKWNRLSSRYDQKFVQKKVNKRSKLYFLHVSFFVWFSWKRKSS